MNATLTLLPPPSPPRAIAPRPLMTLSAVMWRLDRDEDEVLALIDEGALLWAFNVAVPSALKTAPRVLAESVGDYLAGRTRPAGDEEAEWQRVAGLIFPAKETIVRCELARALNCGRTHALSLIHLKQFQVARGTRCRPGPGGSPRIITASAAEWLRKRRLF